MEQILNHYNQQAAETLNLSTPNTQYAFLTFDGEISRGNAASNNKTEINVAYEVLLLFLHYLIAFPVFLLCWFALIAYLRKRGHINQSEAEIMLDEIKNVRISVPTTSTAAFQPSN